MDFPETNMQPTYTVRRPWLWGLLMGLLSLGIIQLVLYIDSAPISNLVLPTFGFFYSVVVFIGFILSYGNSAFVNAPLPFLFLSLATLVHLLSYTLLGHIFFRLLSKRVLLLVVTVTTIFLFVFGVLAVTTYTDRISKGQTPTGVVPLDITPPVKDQ